MTKFEKAAQQAKKELEKESVDKIKKLILENLQKIEDKKAKINELQKELKLLNQDQKDIEAGKIEAILERQEKSKIARKESVFTPSQLGISMVHNDCISGINYAATTSHPFGTASNTYFISSDWTSGISGVYTVNTVSGERDYYIS